MGTGLVALCCIGGATTTYADFLNLVTPGASGTINGAFFEQINPSSTGTGVINPFLRVSNLGNETFEAAYNTSGNLAAPFGQHGGPNPYNKDLLLSEIPVVFANSVLSYQFLLDVNESGNNSTAASIDNKLTLNQLQIFRSSTPGQTAGTIGPNGVLAVGPTFGTPVWEMNVGGGIENGVVLDYGLNTGSGSGDMFVYIPVSDFESASGDYVILYSHFGTPPGVFGTDGGFEEWATLTGVPVVPEPTTIIAGSLLLLPFAASMVRRFRRR